MFYQKKYRLLALFLALIIILAGCGAEPPLSQASIPPESGDDSALETGFALPEENPEKNSGSLPGNYTADIVFSGASAQISGAGAEFSGGVLTVSQAGTYRLSGTLDDGQILIDAGKNDIVHLVLDEVSVHNETGSVIYAPKAQQVELILADGSENNISDGAEYAASGDENEPDAAIFAQDSLSVSGGGTLSVTGNYKHGIRAQDFLYIDGGGIKVKAAGDALRGRDGVEIQNGVFTLEAGGDGIQASNDEDETKGYVNISGGNFGIQAGNDGIQAETALEISGGEFKITTGGGSANAPVQEEDFRGWGGFMGGSSPAETETADTASMKALKSGTRLNITGGNFVIDAEDDAVHTNGNISVSAGKFEIKTGDDGFHADNALEISSGEINILSCYEGIEGLNATISGGDIIISASDDAVNAAGGADNASRWGGPMGTDNFASNGDIFVRISGGTLDLYAAHDGIDANGNIFYEGGSAKISGPSQGMEGAIDLDGAMLVTGGELITAGSVLNASQDSTQPVILVSYTQRQTAGSVISIRDSGGNVLLEYTSKTEYTMSGFTSPDFKAGGTYGLYIDGEKRIDIALSGAVTSTGDDGGAYNGGMGGGRGNWGGFPPGGRRP
ncbi:MAG: carbohydrate-binding domain-containing protein [Oscillospiraceae bacterium]|jgi:hypothetical protein|nr:carbohydrate-binding domain-containing protein [Oscillospiraceae bacterium]